MPSDPVRFEDENGVAYSDTNPIPATLLGAGGVGAPAVAIDQTTPGDTNLVQISRANATESLDILNGASLSRGFEMSLYAMGVVHMPAAWTAANLGFTVSTTLAGTYLPLYDDLGTLVQIAAPAVDCSYALPAALAGCQFVKLWSQNGAGVAVNQGGNRTLTVDLKA